MINPRELSLQNWDNASKRMELTSRKIDPATGQRPARIVVTTFGSLGDLLPFVAIALGLKARGHFVILATGECYREKIERLGIEFRAARPDCVWVNDPKVLRRITHPRWGLLRVFGDVIAPVLRETYEDTLAACEGADLIVAMQINYTAQLITEKKGIPWVSAMHLPVGIYSAYDPPILPGFGGISKTLRVLGPPFWKQLGWLIKKSTRGWAKPLHEFRSELGLPLDTSLNPITDGFAPSLHLALFSKLLANKQPDWPPQTVVTGFPWYDPEGDSGLSPELERFLSDGPPPVVFTLGTAIGQGSGAREFFQQSADAAKLLGRRAILILTNRANCPAELPPGVAAFDFAPFTELFPRAAAIVHHGGIGTTALAMRSGRPMLVIPHAWDQFDNAERAARLGICRIILGHRYTASRAATELRRILDDPEFMRRAGEVSVKLQKENGVIAACDAIEAVLQRTAIAGQLRS
jgi:UDP:flavonoid glycosyltransferase YjiC (YdhE family)